MARLFGKMRKATRLSGIKRLLKATALLHQVVSSLAPKVLRKRRELTVPSPALRAIAALAAPLRTRDARGQTELPQHAAGVLGTGVNGAGGFFAKTFTSKHGTRRYKLYIPSDRHQGPLPLVVMLHGCTQSPDDFATGTRMNSLAEENGFLVLYPEQPVSANAQRCWNWFNPLNQSRGTGEPALIAGMTTAVIRHQRANRQKVYVAGLSAGGATAAIMGRAYPNIYAAIGVHSGLACGAASGIASAVAAMRHGGRIKPHRSAPSATAAISGRLVPTIVFHADGDSTVHPTNADQVLAQAVGAQTNALTATVEEGRVLGGRAYTRTAYAHADGPSRFEHWMVHGAGHAWSGGSGAGTYTDPRGPDASRAMLRFFFAQAHAGIRSRLP